MTSPELSTLTTTRIGGPAGSLIRAGSQQEIIDAVRAADPSLPLRAETDDDAVDFYRTLGFTVTGAPRDARWPARRRYRCEMPPREASA